MSKPSMKLSVTAVVDNQSTVTAYFNELPALVVQGTSIEDCRQKLVSLLKSFVKRLDSTKDFEIKTKVLA